MFETQPKSTAFCRELRVFVAAVWRGAQQHMDSQLVGCLKGNGWRGENALWRECLCVWKEANMFSGGSINRPRAAQRGLSLNDPPQPAVPSPFYVNHLYTKKPLECAVQFAAEESSLSSTEEVPSKTNKLIVWNSDFSQLCFQWFLSVFVEGQTYTVLQQRKHLFESKQTDREQWRASLTAGVANQRSHVAKLLNQVQKSSYL